VNGYPPARLAYIKPMTQCVEKQSVTRFCERMKITCRDVGNLVYRKGFSKDFIAGRTPDSGALRARVIDEIAGISAGKEVVVIDGVGGPADGSVIGLSNVDLAIALRCQVIFVGKPGIGAAIDNTALCQSFLQNKGIQQFRVIYNKISGSELEEIKAHVVARLAELLPDLTLVGFIEYDQQIDDRFRTENVTQIVDWFSRHLNTKLLLDA
jgi:dethiobiotin synthetase